MGKPESQPTKSFGNPHVVRCGPLPSGSISHALVELRFGGFLESVQLFCEIDLIPVVILGLACPKAEIPHPRISLLEIFRGALQITNLDGNLMQVAREIFLSALARGCSPFPNLVRLVPWLCQLSHGIGVGSRDHKIISKIHDAFKHNEVGVIVCLRILGCSLYRYVVAELCVSI